MVIRRVATVVAVLGCVGLIAASPAWAAGPPVVEASWVTGVTSSGATLRAQITANGFSTEYRFEYITQAGYEANLAAARDGFFGATTTAENGIVASATAQKVFQTVQGLKSLVSYRYRAVATNSADTTIGPEHVFTTQPSTLTFQLPDGRGWEMVSPIDKGGGAVGSPEGLFGGGDFQAAENGDAVTWGSATAFGDAAGAPPVSQYVSHHTGSGWATDNVSAALESGGYGDEPDGAPFRVFSSDLSRAVMLDGSRCAIEGTCAPTYSLWPGGAFSGLTGKFGLTFAGAGPGLHYVVFEADDGLYEWREGSLVQLSSAPDAALAAQLGAVSSTGSVYWTQGGNLYLSPNGGKEQIDAEAGGGGTFQTAIPNGSVAYFTKAGHLYSFSSAKGTASDLTPGGGVVGMLGASPDAKYVYYLDAAGLEQWHDGTTISVASGADAAQASDYPPASGTARVSPNGNLAFLSEAELTGYDNADADTGEPDSELYLYRPAAGAAKLICVSCNPTGERPEGPTKIPGAPKNGSTQAYKPRALSDNGNRLIFDTADRLFALDTNKQSDVYQWEASGEGSCGLAPGCVSLLSDGRDPRGFSFVDASGDGADAFFLTNASLVGTDPGSIDLYDARVGGGFPEPAKPTICVGDACQPLPGEPEDPTPGTLVPNSGNPAVRHVKEKAKRKRRKRHRHRRRHHHHRHRAKHRGGGR